MVEVVVLHPRVIAPHATDQPQPAAPDFAIDQVIRIIQHRDRHEIAESVDNERVESALFVAPAQHVPRVEIVEQHVLANQVVLQHVHDFDVIAGIADSVLQHFAERLRIAAVWIAHRVEHVAAADAGLDLSVIAGYSRCRYPAPGQRAIKLLLPLLLFYAVLAAVGNLDAKLRFARVTVALAPGAGTETEELVVN